MAPAEDSPALQALSVFVRGLELQAEIGLYRHERGRTQPLVIDLEAELAPAPVHGVADTVNYETLAAAARTLAASGHIDLVETFAQGLAAACLGDPRITRIRVRVSKPLAISDAAAAGVEILAVRRPPG